MAKINKTVKNKCWRECGERRTLFHCWWECKLVQPCWRKVWRFLKKLKIELPENNLRVLKGQGLGGWGNQLVGIGECTDCMEHWVWYKNNEYCYAENK